MNGTTAYALSKQYVADTADQLGSLKGAPCTIKSITEVDGGQKVTFEWTGTSGTKQTSEMTVKNGVSVTGVSDKGNGTFTLLLSDGSESEPIHTVKGDPFTYSDFTAEQLESLRGEKGYSPTITENADNTDSIYKLDVTTADGTFTTPNLKGTNENGDTSNVQLDETLTDNTKAAPAGMVGEMKKEISSLSEEIGKQTGTGLSTEAIDKLEEVGNYLAYTTADGGLKWTELISILRNGSSGGGSGEAVPATGISLDKTTLSFTDSATQTLVATVEPSDTTDKVVWTSNAESVATVTNGVVKPLSNGSATITATCGSVSATCSVTVDIAEEEPVTLTSISASYSGGDVAVGTLLNDLTGITVTAHYSDGSTANITDYTLSGEITEGSNVITVTYEGMTSTFVVTGVVETPEILYQLPSVTTFDGTNNIDTGVSLLSTDSDWTIVADLESQETGSEEWIFHTINVKSPWEQFGLSRLSTKVWRVNFGTTQQHQLTSLGSTCPNIKIAITHATGNNYVDIKAIDKDGNYSGVYSGQCICNSSVVFNGNIVIGSHMENKNYWKGVANDFKIYSRVLSDDEISAYLV